MEAEFTEYPKTANPTVSTATATADVEFDNPCWYPFEFLATSQTNPGSDSYTGNNIVLSLTKFTIDPPRCKIVYECTSVVRSDGADSDISCDNLQKTGLFGDETAASGTLVFSTDLTDYKNQVYAPGVYVITIRGTATRSTDNE